MDLYLLLKLLHILSATVLFGSGLGIAFFMFMADRSRDVRAIATTARTVVIADFLFTATAVVVQPITGLMLVFIAGYSIWEPWILLSLALYGVTGLCWLPVVWMQMRIERLASNAVAQGQELPAEYFRLITWWFWLGWPAFISVLLIFLLMIVRPTF